jgi:nicotinate-nucleotide pyrophosphorylase (carboxylating)
MTLPAGTLETIAGAYEEDLRGVGDITSTSVIDPASRSEGFVVARKDGRIAGLLVVEACFDHVDLSINCTQLRQDGDDVESGTALMAVSGPTVSLLTAERVALNFLGRMSGIATATRAYVDAVEGTRARIFDTRKTTPGLRSLEKYAVVVGGGVNHRFGLFDAVLIKDNHIAATGSIAAAATAARGALGPSVEIEVEVDTLLQLEDVLLTDADAVLLDNMSVTELRRAVELVDGRLITEASGGIDLDTVGAIAATGVDRISVGRLTHSSPALDVAFDVDVSGGQDD